MTKPNKNNIDEEFAELLDLAFPVNTDVALFDGDSRGLRERFTDFLKQKLQQVSDRKVEDIGNRVECASFSEEPDFECGRVLPISEMMSTVKNPDTFYCKECYQRGVDMENEAMGL